MVFFTENDIPDLTGQIIIVTGGNAGLGYETVRQLSKHNRSRVYLAARTAEKAEQAMRQLRDENPNASPIGFLQLDMASFDSVKTAAKTFTSKESRLDILINNAGIMMTPEGLTREGYEIQFGTNVMGTALLTQLLLPMVRATTKLNPQARVVILSSASEKMAPSDIYQFDQLKTTMSDKHTTARYTTSKIANAHYTIALAEHNKDVKCVCVEPGMVKTNLHHQAAGMFLRPFLNAAICFATPVEKGALSQVWASVSSDAKSGEFYSPVGVTGKGSKALWDPKKKEDLWAYIQKELEGHL